MSRILIDLTDIEQWSGHHGGTQRVVYGIAKNFYLQRRTLSHTVEFVSFDAAEKRFYVSDFTPIYNRVEKITEQEFQQDIDVPETPIGLKHRLKHALKPYIPAAVRQNAQLRVLGGKMYTHIKNGVQRLHAALQEQPTPAATEEPVVQKPWIEFSKHDIVLILGKPWDNLDIQTTLAEQKALHRFKLAQVVYDLIICLYPHLHHSSLVQPYTQNMVGAIKNSDLLLAISESTRNDIKKFSKLRGLSTPKIKVIRLGEDIIQDDTQLAQKPDSRLQKKFILCVGTVEIRKNHVLLYYAYKLAAEKGESLPQLVIVGGQGWLSGDIQHLIVTDPSVSEKIIMLHNIDDRGLLWLYQNCQFTVYPSMYEGWGLPVAESLAYGKPCIATNASSVPEIGGDLLDYFSPYSPEECMQKISLYTNDTYRHKKQKAIQLKYKQTTWEQTFLQTLQYIERI